MASNASVYFAQLKEKKDGLWDYLHGLPQSKNLDEKQETEWREFKGFPGLKDPDLLKKIKMWWSEALSGFCNTEGGVLIFGLDARKSEETGVDAVKGLSLVGDPVRFAQVLNDYRLDAVDPVIQGTEVIAVTKPGEDKGFIVCYAPEGIVKPYRSQNTKHYYIRAADSFVIPGVSLLRSLFYSKITPFLVPSFVTRRYPEQLVLIGLQLMNKGSATAERIHFRISVSGFKRVDAVLPTGMSYNQNTNEYVISREILVHPGQAMSLLTLEPIPQEIRDHGGKIRLSIFCRDAQPSRWVCKFNHYDIAEDERGRDFDIDNDSDG